MGKLVQGVQYAEDTRHNFLQDQDKTTFFPSPADILHLGVSSKQAAWAESERNSSATNRDENNGSGSGSQSSGNSYNSSSDESLDMMIQEDNDDYESNTNNEKNNLLSEVKALICNPVYIFTCIGYSAFTAVTAGFAFYAPTFVQRNNPCLNVQGPCTNEWHFSPPRDLGKAGGCAFSQSSLKEVLPTSQRLVGVSERLIMWPKK